MSVQGPSAITSPRVTVSPTFTSGRWLMQVVLVRALELAQPVDVDARARPAPASRWRARRSACASTWSMTPARRAMIAAPESRATTASIPVPTKRRLGSQQRHRLALHVRAHQRAVGVVVLQERDQRGRDRDQLLRRDVDQVDRLGRVQHEFARLAGARPGRSVKLPFSSEVGVRLGDGVAHFLGRRHVVDLVGHLAVHHLAVGGFDEAVLVHPRDRWRAS